MVDRPDYPRLEPGMWAHTPVPKGCICPPASEKTCQRIDCGRKSPPTVSAGSPLPNPPSQEGTG